MTTLAVITKRSDFLLAAKSGFKFVKPAFVVQVRKRDSASDTTIRIGFTATKKLGNAVMRNRAKRRLRVMVRTLVPEFGVEGCDYVFIGRDAIYTAGFNTIMSDMRHSLRRLADQLKA